MDEPLIDDTHHVTPSRRPKKKSTLAKLAEKKRKALLSDANSEFGSVASVQKPNASSQHLAKGDSEAVGAASEKKLENIEFIQCSTKDPSPISIHRDKPMPKPRKRARSTGNGASNVEMEVDEDLTVAKNGSMKNDNLKGSQTDSTMHRFRNLRMATERSNSVESVKSSPYVPKPPTTPRSSRNSSKGEKRIRDPSSSGEEADSYLKKSLFSTNPKEDRNTSFNSRTQENTHDSSRELKKLEETSFNKGTNQCGTLGSVSDLQAISQEYSKIVEDNSSQQNNLPFESGKNGSHSAVLSESDILQKTNKYLPPVTPNTRPPPLPGSFSSKVLRTAYKSDSMYYGRTVPNSVSEMGTQSNSDNMSQRSFATSSVLQTITIKEARSRSFLNGSMSSTSLLGQNELERYFPDRQVHVFVGSWNMNETKDVPSKGLNDFLLPESCEYVQDIYCVGSQENALTKREWEIRLQETIGPSHVLFHSVTHGALHLAIFIRRDLIWFCSAPEEDRVSTRAVTMVKTKGAVASCFTFFGTSFLFINCHFTADMKRKKERLNDYKKVITGINLPKALSLSPTSSSQNDVTSRFDCVYWCGDLNFRLERKRKAVEGLVTHIKTQEFPNFEALLGGDQLNKLLIEDKIFLNFQEGRINFSPTYKFDVNSDRYDTSSKSRIPSYTDRILFRCKKKNAISCAYYDAVTSMEVSDHRPVFAVFETLIRPGKDHFLLEPGHFDRSVYMEANKRRARQQLEKKELDQKHSTLCSIQ